MGTTDTDARHAHLRDVLTAARKGKKLTQVELGERLGQNQVWVSKYEAGTRKLDVIEFLDIAKAIGVNPCRLIKELNMATKAQRPQKSR